MALAVMLLNGMQGVLKGLLDGLDLVVPVHVELVHVHLFPHGEANVGLDLLDGCWLVAGLLRRDVVGPSHPRQGLLGGNYTLSIHR